AMACMAAAVFIASKADSPLNQQVSHRARGIARDLAEVRRGRIEVGYIHLRAVSCVERVHFKLEGNAFPAFERSLYVGVQPVQAVRPNPVHPLRENPRLKRRRLLGRRSLEPASVEPLVEWPGSRTD